jgi:phosphate transport system protein
VARVVETRHIDEDLEILKSRLMAMGALAEERMCAAVDALVAGDGEKLRLVRDGDQPLNDLQMEVDDRCFRLIALQHPVAIDLRFIVAATKVTVELERIGDQAVNIAEAAGRYLEHRPVKPLIDLPRMSTVARGMLVTALEAFLTKNSALAGSVLAMDDSLDELKNQVFRELLTYILGDRNTIEAGIDLILISRHLERIGDHATNIAEDAIFLADARDVRHGNRTLT